MACGGWSRRSVLQTAAVASISGVVAGCTTPTPGAARDTDWPMAGFDPAHTSVAPAGAGPEAPPSQRWEVETPQAVTSQPAIAEGVLYLPTLGGRVLTVSAGTGTVQSVTEMRSPSFGTPAVADATVYIGTGAGNLWAYETSDTTDTGIGQFRWRADARGGLVGSPTVMDGTVYAGTSNGHLHAFDATTGREVWVTTIGGSGAVSPAVQDMRVFVTKPPGTIVAIEARTGRIVWETSLPGGMSAGVTVRDGRLFVGTKTNRVYDDVVKVYALDMSDGREQWQATIGGSANGFAAVTEDTVVVATWNGSVHGLDSATGDEKWRAEFARDPTGSPAIAGETVYISVFDRRIYALDVESGQRIWDLKLDGVPAPPVVASGGLFAATTENTVYRFDSATRST